MLFTGLLFLFVAVHPLFAEDFCAVRLTVINEDRFREVKPKR
jgi:hypothetical protein